MKRRDFLGVLATTGAGLAIASEVRSDRLVAPSAITDTDKLSWDEIRALFPLRRDRVYLNTGGLGPAPQVVLDAMSQQAATQAHEGEHGHGLFQTYR